ncbi:hypothetical protein EV122DRAFT_223866 [Schizophyllum commune]
MSTFSSFAIRPYRPEAIDLPDAFEVGGLRFVGFGLSPNDFPEGVLDRRLRNPQKRLYEFSGPDWTSIYQFTDAYIPLWDAAYGNPTTDPLFFVLDDDCISELEQGCGLHQLSGQWRARFEDLQTSLTDAVWRLLAAFPADCWARDRQVLGAVVIDADTLQSAQESLDEAQAAAWDYKRAARRNLGMLNWLCHSFPWWPRALNSSSESFVRSLGLSTRPKRGCLVDLLADWGWIDLAHLLDHDVPFACCWTPAVDHNKRFMRLRSDVLWSYFHRRALLRHEPRLEELKRSPEEQDSLKHYDFLLQDRRIRGAEPKPLDYDASLHYHLQFHDGWRTSPITDSDYIKRCLERYAAWTPVMGRPNQVVIEAWSVRGPRASMVEETVEFESVVIPGPTCGYLAGQMSMDSQQRREMYKFSLAPYAGRRFLPWGGEFDLVPYGTDDTLAELEQHWMSVVARQLTTEDGELGLSPPTLLTRLSDHLQEGEYNYPDSERDYTQSPYEDSDPSEEEDSLEASVPAGAGVGIATVPVSQPSRAGQPRRMHPAPDINLDQPFVLPDPLLANRNDLVTQKDGDVWRERYELVRRSIAELALYLFGRAYPRIDDDFFAVSWANSFINYGYIYFERPQDRVRFRALMDVHPLWTPEAALSQLLVAGVRFACGYDNTLAIYESPAVIGPRPRYRKIEPLPYQKGGTTLFAAYRAIVEELCQHYYGPSFVYYGGLVSAIARRWGGDHLRGRLGEGVSVKARYHSLGEVVHSPDSGTPILFEKLEESDIDHMLGAVVGLNGETLWMFPPRHKWDAEWLNNGEWNLAEEAFFRDIAGGLETGARTAITEYQWFKILQGRSHKMKGDPTRTRQLSAGVWEAWSEFLDFSYSRPGEIQKVATLVGGERVRRIPAL